MASSKVITARQAADLLQDGTTVGWTTAGLCGFAEDVAAAVEERFVETGSPKNIRLFHCCGCGDHKDRGTNHLGHEGLVTAVISGHIGEAPKVGALVNANKATCHLLPQGVLTHQLRQMAGKKPGVLTKIGLGTFADPRLEGGKINSITTEDLVKVVEFEGEEYLYYKPFKIDVAIFRGSTADERGNVTMDREALFLEALALASAVKNNGGMVIAQVEYLAKPFTLHPKSVKVPGVLVDYVVLAKPENHMQTKKTQFNPALCGESKVPLSGVPVLPLDERKVISRRAAMELIPNSTLNLGIGMPDGVSSVAAEEGISDLFTMTTELGNFGGMPAGGPDFPSTYNSECTIEHPSMFDFYDGGGLSTCVLGLAQTDKEGNLNVSKFGTKVVGPGGFINISTSARKVIFVGTMMAGAEYEIKDGQLKITKEGNIKKFVDKVTQVTFSGTYAAKANKPVLYVTERAVFSLENGAMTLIEIAPGLDLEKDILAAMDFKPVIASPLKEMPREIFQEKWGKLKDIVTAK
ncbi:MAG: acyl CoA:acetate/3-ketoacid CoA transferase [Peptococcaceae bacterium]|jgi:propionate CoA-transferase|nr:acyl CoA:acetate/3-ketoacid CoA transferase [Peptococcaceae bacterium]